MKRTIMNLALLTLGLVSVAQTLTTKEMIKDIDYLNNKIQKQFQSFTPGIKEAFQLEIDDLKEKAPMLKPHEFPCEIMRVLSTLKDGHTELNIGHRKVGFHRMPLLVYFFEGDLRVIAAHEEYQELLGSTIVAIGKKPIEEVFGTLKQRMSADNEMEYLHAGPGYLILTELLDCMGFAEDPHTSSVTFQLVNDESRQLKMGGLTLDEYQSGPWRFVNDDAGRPLYQSNRGKSYWYQWLPEEQVMYVHIRRMNNQKGASSIKSFSARLFDEIDEKRPAKLVIDFRNNNGGNYHLSRPIVEGIKKRAWLNEQGKLWTITGRRTFSAASTATIFLKTETAATIIGEPGRTHPNKSDNNEYMDLPNSDYLIEYTTRIKKKWPERPELTAIPVDVEIIPDFESYKQGRDKVLEYILEQ